MKNPAALSLLLLAVVVAACSSKTTYQPLPIASASAPEDGETLALKVDGTLCDRFAACDPKLFAAVYPSAHEECLENLFGSGRGVHVSASSSDQCTAELNASCAFLGVDAGIDAAHFSTQDFALPTSCTSN